MRPGDVRRLSDRWVEQLKHPTERIDAMTTPQRFEDHLNELVSQSVNDLARESAADRFRGMSAEQIVQKFWDEHPRYRTSQNGPAQSLNSMYSKAYQRATKLGDIRRQENWATSCDHVKFLLFRSALALAIMFVVLLTGHLAQEWGVVLPGLRVMSAPSG
jgi:hypothetical protein